MHKPITVCLTADIEFEIRGALSYPDRCSPAGAESVFREVRGHSQGLGALLSPLIEFDLPATFFVETMQVAYFGLSPMQRVLRSVDNHELIDVQLHTHPCWDYLSNSNWRQTVTHIAKNDSMAGRGVQGATAVLAKSIDYFLQLTTKKPVAFRAGSLRVDADLFQALADVGLLLSSSVGKGYFEPSDPVLSLWSGVARMPPVTEIPVTSYQIGIAGKFLPKILTITGTPLSNIIRIIEYAARNGRGPIVLLTHASEMASDISTIFEPPSYAPNLANQLRWRELCRYLHDNRERFTVLTLGTSDEHWMRQPAVSHPPYRGRIRDLSMFALRRLVKGI